MDIYQVIKKPLLTEKGGLMRERGNYYAFAVDRRATKEEIRQAVETLFKVHVTRVNTITLPGKAKRFGKFTSAAMRTKKAVVKIKKEEKIDKLEGV
ncbi:MAG: 50S ribosomal protein L23 [Spirochaetia bacterium]|nr:50S ribosomal protein L23 [Spirochaetia bacterium]